VVSEGGFVPLVHGPSGEASGRLERDDESSWYGSIREVKM
jgi:hypothetical protein